MLDDTWYSHGDLNGKTKHKSRTILFLWINWFLCLDLQRLSIKHSFLCDSASTMVQPCWKLNNGYKNRRFLFYMYSTEHSIDIFQNCNELISSFGHVGRHCLFVEDIYCHLLSETHLHAAMSLTILRFVSWSSAYPQSLCFLSSMNTHEIACPEKC